MVVFTEITLQADRSWKFTWDSTGDDFKVVLNGRQKSIVVNPDSGDPYYIFNEMGPYSVIPPPIEVVPLTSNAESEIDRPFQRFQWYADPIVDTYELQEYVSGTWVTRQRLSANTSSPVYSISTVLLNDEQEYQYRLIGYNATGAASPALLFTIFAASQPIFDDANLVVQYNESTNEIDISLT